MYVDESARLGSIGNDGHVVVVGIEARHHLHHLNSSWTNLAILARMEEFLMLILIVDKVV